MIDGIKGPAGDKGARGHSEGAELIGHSLKDRNYNR